MIEPIIEQHFTSMKHLALGLAIIASCYSAFATSSHSTRGHVRRDGTYVAPSRATNPDHTKSNNYSNKGNYNPYNGKRGTRQ